MRPVGKTATIAILFFLAASCGQSNEARDSMRTKDAYSLCPMHDDSRRKLYELVRDFSNQQQARLIDRGAEAQQELFELKSKVLRDTGGEIILLTIEKPEEFRISITNLGLREKIALAIGFRGESREDSPVGGFMDDLSRFWRIERVDGGVTNDPPC